VRVVEVVRGRHVDDVDSVVAEHRLEALVRLGQGHLRRLRPRPVRRRPDDADDLDAQPAERLDVDDADEARADDGSA